MKWKFSLAISGHPINDNMITSDHVIDERSIEDFSHAFVDSITRVIKLFQCSQCSPARVFLIQGQLNVLRSHYILLARMLPQLRCFPKVLGFVSLCLKDIFRFQKKLAEEQKHRRNAGSILNQISTFISMCFQWQRLLSTWEVLEDT